MNATKHEIAQNDADWSETFTLAEGIHQFKDDGSGKYWIKTEYDFCPFSVHDDGSFDLDDGAYGAYEVMGDEAWNWTIEQIEKHANK